MSFDSLKKLSELFNVELQETKLKLIERKETVLDKFNLEKLNLQKELNQIEESLEFFENENDILVKALMIKEKEFANTQQLYEYEKKSLNSINQEKLELALGSKDKIADFLEKNKEVLQEGEKEKIQKMKVLEEKIKVLDEEIKVYEENLGLKINILDKNRFKIEFKFIEKPGFSFSFELFISNEGEFQMYSNSSKIDFSQEVSELNINKRINLFLYKVRERIFRI